VNFPPNSHSRRAVKNHATPTRRYNHAVRRLIAYWIVSRVIRWARAIIDAELDDPCRSCAQDVLDILLNHLRGR